MYSKGLIHTLSFRLFLPIQSFTKRSALMQAALASLLAPLMLSSSIFGAGLTPGELPKTTEYASPVDIAFGCPAPWCVK